MPRLPRFSRPRYLSLLSVLALSFNLSVFPSFANAALANVVGFQKYLDVSVFHDRWLQKKDDRQLIKFPLFHPGSHDEFNWLASEEQFAEQWLTEGGGLRLALAMHRVDLILDEASKYHHHPGGYHPPKVPLPRGVFYFWRLCLVW